MKNHPFHRMLSLLSITLLTASLLACDMSPSEANTPNLEAQPISARPTLRINAGVEEPLKDSAGITWAPDSGFDGGLTNDRTDLEITGTKTPEIYRSERYSMNAYSFKLPPGKYLLKLHFSEDFDGITSPNDRLFTYTVKDGDTNGKILKEVKNFSPWKAAGAQFKAYVDSIPLTLTSGQLTITFTPEVENPQINAIEILPQ